MISNKTYTSKEIKFGLEDLKDRKEPTKVLLAMPDYFDIIDVKNVHMKDQQGRLDKELAFKQWQELKSFYENLQNEGVLENVYTLPGQPSCEDMVFAANQSFPWKLEGENVVVLSKMFHESRRREVAFFETFYKDLGYGIFTLQETDYFEGMGDTIPHPGKNLLYGGYGHRTTAKAYDELATLLKVPVVTLELRDERFYHLDTCFLPLDQNTVLLCREAFTSEGLASIQKLFRNVVAVPTYEAQHYFTLNAHVINIPGSARVAILQKGSNKTVEILRKFGFKIKELDTSEYMKSGGSVFCMKMMIY